ncbi:PLC-like phosphodiesterase [Macrolepiota fuliginosa MF-IS2]|uniref:PLC-like phosphodiesterase n=1 Tax=Macrolepiota fuliginosa MF-IS2 TaxID=1400762 RepID=A0A9P5XNY9_9AGAR|nr:PLC-like phosphodiesterase [Macrolepiota fuliginosa MF-IS2]
MRLSLTTRQLTSLFLVPLSALCALGAPQRTNSEISRRATVCNGHVELCNKSFGSVSFVGAHDSYAIGVNSLAVNQDQNITTQLDDGIRMLQMQAHGQDGDIRLCHTSCSLYDGGTLGDFLKQGTLSDHTPHSFGLRTWLDANPNEVLSLLIVNIDSLPVAQYDQIFKSAGLDAISFAPESTPLSANSWPTLGSMIDSGKRLVTFMDHGADASVPYIIDEFSNVWETEFNVVDAFDCNINRTNQNVDPTGQMYLINHFLDKLVFNQPVPFIEKLNETNASSGNGSLAEQVDNCTAQHSKPPNFLLVDFYEFGGGSVFDVAARINGVQNSPTKPIATPVSSASSSSSAQTTSRPLNAGASTFGVVSYELAFSLISALAAVVAGPSLLL